jgi:hypothetical protein
LTDNFLEEVEERLRSERYRSLGARALPWIIGAVVLALLAAAAWWGYGEWRRRDAAKASEAYATALASAQGGDLDKAFVQFGDVAKLSSPAYDALALMSQGAVRIEQNRTQEAVALFDKAAKASNEPILEDAARLKAAFALMDTAPYAAVAERLQPLLAEGRPFRPAAREALAMAKLQAGQVRQAREDFAIIPITPGVPDAMSERAQAMVALIDSGTAAQLPAIARQMRAAPRGPAAAPPLPPGAASPPQAQSAPSGAAQ